MLSSLSVTMAVLALVGCAIVLTAVISMIRSERSRRVRLAGAPTARPPFGRLQVAGRGGRATS